jgi:hypothetical protein
MSENKIALTLSQRCRALAGECRSKAQAFRNVKPRTQMPQIAADYERKANLAEILEISLRTPYDQNAPLPEIFEKFLTPLKDGNRKISIAAASIQRLSSGAL